MSKHISRRLTVGSSFQDNFAKILPSMHVREAWPASSSLIDEMVETGRRKRTAGR